MKAVALGTLGEASQWPGFCLFFFLDEAPASSWVGPLPLFAPWMGLRPPSFLG